MSQLTDRRVHAEDGKRQLVRYDRSAKWYVEPKPGAKGVTKEGPLTIEVAVERAIRMRRNKGSIHFGVIGGQRFDAAVRKHDA